MTALADYLAQQLKARGVERVYGLPGGENVEVLEAIRRQGIDFVLVKNESSALFMAAAGARLGGGIGVALTTLGPGAANAYAGLAHAHLDRAPLLLLTAMSDPQLIGTHSHQVIDLSAAFRPLVKFTAQLSAHNAATAIQHALNSALAGRPGPVHLGITNRAAVQPLPPLQDTAALTHSPAAREIPAAQLKTFLQGRQKPVIVVGLGLEPAKPYASIRRLAESLSAPLIDTPKSKGALSAAHPLFAGTLGLTHSDPAYAILDEADCIIAIGFDPVELVKPWRQPQPLLWIAGWENQDPHLPCELECVGSIAETVDALSAVKMPGSADWGAARVRRHRQERAQRARALPAAQPHRLLPQSLLDALRAHTPDDVIITTDVGSHKIFAALNWPARQPNRYFVSNGLSAMGFGLCSAIAAAQQQRGPVICITGDAGLAMVMGELGLLRELGLAVIVLVMNDAALDLIRSAQMRRRHPVFATEFSNPDYAHIAKGYGLAYHRIERAADCADALRAALQSGQPALLDAMIDPRGYPTTPGDA